MKPVLGVALLASLLPAQRTFVVDASNGPGTHFTDLAVALAQAQHGDVYLVRAGAYQPVTTDKGVCLLAVGAATILPATNVPSLAVRRLPAGYTFTLKGFAFPQPKTLAAIDLGANQGRVQIENVTTSGTPGTGSLGMQASACRLVAMTGCTLTQPMVVTDSVLVALDCVVGVGIDGTTRVGLQSVRSTVQLIGGSYIGGAGIYGCCPVPAVTDTGGTLTLGTSGLPLSLGVWGGSVSNVSGLLLSGTRLLLDPKVQIGFNGSAPRIGGTGTITTRALATLSATDTWLGNTAALSLFSPPGDPYFVVVGPAADPVPWLVDTLFVDLAASATLAVGTQLPAGSSVFPLVVPNDAALRGLVVAFQAASWSSTASILSLTNPALRVLE